MIAAVRIPLRQAKYYACNSEIVLIDLDSKAIMTIANENMPYEVKFEIYRSNPKINNKYISWYNNGFDGMYIYDYNKNKYIEVYKEENDIKGNNTFIYKTFDRYIFLYLSRSHNKDKKICIELEYK